MSIPPTIQTFPKRKHKNRRACAHLILIFLVSCREKEYTTEECKTLETPKAYIDRCMGGKINGSYVGDLECWPFSAPKRFRGVYVGSYESSEFFPNVTTFKQTRYESAKIWVDLEANASLPLPLQKRPSGQTQAFLIDAEGRLSLCDGWFGHLGSYPRELIINRFYSASPIPAN